MKKRYAKFKILLFIIVLLGIGLGYAFLQTNLNITGTTVLKDNRWDIHLENVDVRYNNGNTEEPTINASGDTVTYSVTLEQPGDFYQFNVDCKNDGTIDGMISSVTSKLNGNPITNLPAALRYYVSYEDGIEIEPNHLLAAGAKDTYTIRVEYRTDIDAGDLPSTETTLNLSFTITYIQADNNAELRTLGDKYSQIFSRISINSTITATDELYTDYNELDMNDDKKTTFIKHSFDVDGKVTNNTLVYSYNNLYYLYGGTNESALSLKPIYEANKATLISAFGSSKCTEEQKTNDGTYIIITCQGDEGYEMGYATDKGKVYAFSNSDLISCMINEDGSSECGGCC